MGWLSLVSLILAFVMAVFAYRIANSDQSADVRLGSVLPGFLAIVFFVLSAIAWIVWVSMK